MQLDKKNYGTIEVAKMLGVSAFAVWRWCKMGKIKAWKTPGGHYRIPAKRWSACLGRWAGSDLYVLLR